MRIDDSNEVNFDSPMEPSTLNRDQITPIPLVILAGSDPSPADLPESGAELHPIKGPKGMALRVGGRPLIDLLLEPLKECGFFDPIYIAGPVSEYGESRQGCRVIDTNAGFGANIRAALDVVLPENPDGIVGVTTCDILPRVEELEELMGDYFSRTPINYWFPFIETPTEPERLGASYWKPKYQVVQEPGGKPVTFLPGHLIVADIDSARLPLAIRCFDLAYKTRNRPILYRLVVMVSGVFAGLLGQDFKHLFALRMPTMTVSVVLNGILLALEIRRGDSTAEQLSDRLDRMMVRYRHRKKFPERSGRLVLMQGLSLAKDFDTQEEAAEIHPVLKDEPDD